MRELIATTTDQHTAMDEETVARELVERVISRGLQEISRETSSDSVAWPSGDQFTADRGRQAIERTVKVLYCISDCN